MTTRFFTLTIAGETCYGLAWDSEAARDEFLAARGIVLVDSAPPTAPSATPPEEVRPPGRPSLNGIIAAAIEELGDQLSADDSNAAQARVVREHLLETLPPDDVPTDRTVRNYLKLNPIPRRRRVGNNSGNNSGKNPATI
jgi:hypothetical protein